jgi:epsilon-lactone hydrolase
VPSLSSTLTSFVLRTTGHYKKRFSGGAYLQKNLVALRAAVSEPSAKWRAKLDIHKEMFEGRAVWHIGPKASAAKARVLYFHGGGYVYQAASAHWDCLCHMTDKHGLHFIAPLYPLAPEAKIDAIADYAVALYREVLTRHDASDIVIGGDSAGGGLTVTTVMLARAAGLPMPAGTLLICPWVDTSASHPDQVAIDPRDPILAISGIRSIGTILAPDAPFDPALMDPIKHDFADYPQTLMFGGGDDILVTDARALKAKQPAIEYHEAASMMHVWPLFFFPESRAAQAQMAGFVGRVTA